MFNRYDFSFRYHRVVFSPHVKFLCMLLLGFEDVFLCPLVTLACENFGLNVRLDNFVSTKSKVTGVDFCSLAMSPYVHAYRVLQ